MSQDRRSSPGNTDWEKADEELRQARRLYDNGHLTFRQFGMTSILHSFKERVLSQYTISWRLSGRPEVNTRFENKCRYRIKLKKRVGNTNQGKKEPLRYIYVESSDADFIDIVSQIEERLPIEGLTPDLILGALIEHVETATVQSKGKLKDYYSFSLDYQIVDLQNLTRRGK